MKIVTSDEFLKMPSGTIFADTELLENPARTVQAGEFEGLMYNLKVKEETICDEGKNIDFFFKPLIGNHLQGVVVVQTMGESFTIEPISERDGTFGETLVYVVYEDSDIKSLIGELQKHLNKEKE